MSLRENPTGNVGGSVPDVARHHVDRIDGVLKVTGRAHYTADHQLPNVLQAIMVTSTIAAGEVASVDTGAAERMPGVRLVMTPFNAPRLPENGRAAAGEMPAGRVMNLLQDTSVRYNNQPIALVVADTLDQAREAACHLRIAYRRQPATLDFAKAKARAYEPRKVKNESADTARGDLDAAMREATTTIDATYTTPMQHHNAMEPHATIAAWDGDTLTLYDATQYVAGVRKAVAKTFGIPAGKVRVICPFVGGGFGGKGSVWSHVVLAAMAARAVGRPVKLAVERPQLFGPAGARPPTEQRVMAAARADGTLTGLRHDVVTATSYLEDWVEPAAMMTRLLYGCPTVHTSHRLVKLHIGTPTFMRAPGDASGSFALESALDELAHALKVDPVELRLRNDTDIDLSQNLPFSSRRMSECFRLGAERFGWWQRDPAPRSMRADGKLAGMGVATATYPAMRQSATATAIIEPDGSACIRCATHDLGTGTYTVMTQVAAQALGIPAARIRFELGDTAFPDAPIAGGSQTVASVAPAVQAAASAARQVLVDRAVADRASPLFGAPPEDVAVADGWLARTSDPACRESIAAAMARNGGQRIEATRTAEPGDEAQHHSMHSFGAIFAEVHVDPDLGEVRVPRMLGVFGVGRLLNRKTGHSQLMGGMVWGIGLALHEESLLDPRSGRIANGNLAEYHVPVNADVGQVEVMVVDEFDPHINPLGAKGIGEIGIVGAGAAIANAVFHATGKRIRHLPITPDKLL